MHEVFNRDFLIYSDKIILVLHVVVLYVKTSHVTEYI